MEVGLGNEIGCTIEQGYPEPTKWKWTKKGHPENVLSSKPSLKFVNPTEEDEAVYCVEVCIHSFWALFYQGFWICHFQRWKMGWPRTDRRSWWKSKVTFWCWNPLLHDIFADTIANNEEKNEERFEKMFEKSKFPMKSLVNILGYSNNRLPPPSSKLKKQWELVLAQIVTLEAIYRTLTDPLSWLFQYCNDTYVHVIFRNWTKTG